MSARPSATRALDGWFNAGYTLGNLGRYAEALVALDQALALNPDEGAAWNNKGVALNRLTRYAEVLVAFDRALALNPNSYHAWMGKGITLRALGRMGAAEEAERRAQEVDADSAVAWTGKGSAWPTRGPTDEAPAAYDRALDVDADSAVAWRDKGGALWESKRHREALALDPHDTVARQSRSIAVDALGRKEPRAVLVRTRADMGRLGVLRFRFSQHPLLMTLILLLTSMLAGILGSAGYRGLQRVGLLHPTPTIHATSVPKHEPTPAIAPGFAGFENASFSLAYPSDWTHTHHDDTLNARNLLHSDDFEGAGSNEVLIGTTASVPGDQLQIFLSAVVRHQFRQWTIDALAVNRHVTYDHEQWLENDKKESPASHAVSTAVVRRTGVASATSLVALPFFRPSGRLLQWTLCTLPTK